MKFPVRKLKAGAVFFYLSVCLSILLSFFTLYWIWVEVSGGKPDIGNITVMVVIVVFGWAVVGLSKAMSRLESKQKEISSLLKSNREKLRS